MWFIYATLSAITASLVALFSKIGLRSVDPIVAATMRAIIMVTFLTVGSFTLNKLSAQTLSSFTLRDILYIVAAGIAGGLSWTCYLMAMKDGGDAGKVASVDHLSVAFTLIFSALFLGEAWSIYSLIGVILMVSGVACITRV